MQKLSIIKVGGKVIEDPVAMNGLLQNFSKIEGLKILVHGGGKTATEIGLKMGIQPNMVDGRRITDAETIDLVTMVYAGLVNKRVVAKLQALSINAVGLTGADLNSIISIKRLVKTIDYGFVGDVISVNTKQLETLLNDDVVPVFCALTHDGKGQMLNTNADTIASSLACALAKYFNVCLIYCFEKSGVLMDAEDDSTLIKELDYLYYQELKAKGIIHTGMIPKLDNSFEAIKSGIAELIICKESALGSGNIVGTRLRL